jgi:hypothetical protein
LPTPRLRSLAPRDEAAVEEVTVRACNDRASARKVVSLRARCVGGYERQQADRMRDSMRRSFALHKAALHKAALCDFVGSDFGWT